MSDAGGRPKKAPSGGGAARPRAAAKGRRIARAPRLGWHGPLIFALLAPPLFMVLDMSIEQATSPSGFSVSRLGSWIAEDGFYALKAVYLIGIVPAALAGLLIARREQRSGPALLFALLVLVLFSLPVAVLFARNLFLFAPPPFGEQLLIAGRVIAGVVISGLVCYALSRLVTRGIR